MDTAKPSELIDVQSHDNTKFIKFEQLETSITIRKEIIRWSNQIVLVSLKWLEFAMEKCAHQDFSSFKW